MANLDL